MYLPMYRGSLHKQLSYQLGQLAPSWEVVLMYLIVTIPQVTIKAPHLVET